MRRALCACYRKYFLLRLMSALINWSASSQRNGRQMCSHGKLHWDESWVPAHDNNSPEWCNERTKKKNRNGFRSILKSGNVTAAADATAVACINKFRIAYPQFARQYALWKMKIVFFSSLPVSLSLRFRFPTLAIDTPTTFVWMLFFFSDFYLLGTIFTERAQHSRLVYLRMWMETINTHGKYPSFTWEEIHSAIDRYRFVILPNAHPWIKLRVLLAGQCIRRGR